MPLKHPTTTPTPDEIFDEWLGVLGHAELRVLLYIVRRTFGFGKRGGDGISFTQFLKGITTRDGRVLDRGCGVRNRTNLARALARLEERGLIRSEKRRAPPGDRAVTVYAVCFEDADHVRDDPQERGTLLPSVGGAEGSTAAVPGGTAAVPPGTGPAPPGGTAVVPRVVPQRYPQETERQQTAMQQTGRHPATTGAPVRAEVGHAAAPSPTTDGAALALWRAVRDEVRRGITEDNYERWFATTRVGRWEGTTLQIVVPSDFQRRWLDDRLRRHVKRALTVLGCADTTIAFVVDSA